MQASTTHVQGIGEHCCICINQGYDCAVFKRHCCRDDINKNILQYISQINWGEISQPLKIIIQQSLKGLVETSTKWQFCRNIGVVG